jgi:hypothetical protein
MHVILSDTWRYHFISKQITACDYCESFNLCRQYVVRRKSCKQGVPVPMFLWYLLFPLQILNVAIIKYWLPLTDFLCIRTFKPLLYQNKDV